MPDVPDPIRHVRWNDHRGRLEFSRANKLREALIEDDFDDDDAIEFEPDCRPAATPDPAE